jgi:hypothetical protein
MAWVNAGLVLRAVTSRGCNLEVNSQSYFKIEAW